MNENRIQKVCLKAQNYRNLFLTWTVSNTSGVLARVRDWGVVYWTPLIRVQIRFIAVLLAEGTIFLHPAYCVIIGMLCAGAKFISTWFATESFFSQNVFESVSSWQNYAFTKTLRVYFNFVGFSSLFFPPIVSFIVPFYVELKSIVEDQVNIWVASLILGQIVPTTKVERIHEFQIMIIIWNIIFGFNCCSNKKDSTYLALAFSLKKENTGKDCKIARF